MSARTPFPPQPPTKSRAGVDQAPLPPPKEQPHLPVSFAEKLRVESERGVAGVLSIDWDVALGGGGAPALAAEFAGVGPWARDGFLPCGCVAIVAKNGPRDLQIESERPGRSGRYPVRESFAPTVGADGSLHNPHALTWLRNQTRDLREAPDVRHVPLMVLIENDVVGNLTPELAAALTELAKDQRCVIGVIRYVRGGGAIEWVPSLEDGTS